MRDDLLEAYAACSWAGSQLPLLKKRIDDWIARPAYEVVEELRPEIGKKFFKLKIDRRIGDSLINAEVGVIINSLRSSLDLLASALAIRNGKRPCRDHHFPIYLSLDDFIKPKNATKRKKWLSDKQMMTIEKLKPYKGGDNELFALHHLDIARKHVRLIRFQTVPKTFILDPDAYAQGFEFATAIPGLSDGAVIGWTDIDAVKYNFHLMIDITFDEPDILPSAPIFETLRRFYGMVDGIIQHFERD
jgi:hypothetical protein